MKEKKYTLSSRRIEKLGDYPEKAIDKSIQEHVELFKYRVDFFVKAQIKDKPVWFPSQRLWEKIAGKFLNITIQRKYD